MKKIMSVICVACVVYFSSCAKHRVCPTYTKNAIKHVKTEAPEKI